MRTVAKWCLVPGLLAKWCLVPALLAGCATSKSLMALHAPIGALRAQPHTVAQPGIHDPLQETQLVYGERVRLLKIQDGWARVEAVELHPTMTCSGQFAGMPTTDM